jgi:thioredoxin 1
MKNKHDYIWWGLIALAFAGVLLMRFRPSAHVELADIYDANLPTMMELGASWCPPCRAIKPVMKDLQDNYSGFNVRYVDVEQDAATARKYNVSAIPVIVFMDAAGNTLHTQVGYISKNSVLARWEQLGVEVTKIR